MTVNEKENPYEYCFNRIRSTIARLTSNSDSVSPYKRQPEQSFAQEFLGEESDDRCMSNNHASYLTTLFNRRKQEDAIIKIKELLFRQGNPYNGFVATGLSGTGMAFILGRELNKKVVIVRKEDNYHSGWDVENLSPQDKLLFVDDFIASGQTIRKVFDKIKTMGETKNYLNAKVVGSLTYDPLSLCWGEEALY